MKPVDPPETFILAAGASRRFGTPKALAPWGTTCLLAQVVRTTTEATGSIPWLVLGAAADLIEARLNAEAVRYRPLRHAHWAQGLSASLHAAITQIAPQPQTLGALIILGDQPAIRAEDLRQLITLWQATPEHPVAAEYAGQVGAPCILPRSMFDRVATLQGDQGARSLLREALNLRRYPLPAAAWDVDTPEDLRAAWLRVESSLLS